MGRAGRSAPVAGAVFLAALLGGSGFHLAQGAGAELLRAVSDPPGLARLAFALALGSLAAWVFSHASPGLARPFLALALALLPLVAVAVGRFPLLLLFQGRVLPLLLAIAGGVALARALRGSPAARARCERLSAPALFAAAFVAYAGLGLFLPGVAGPQGDEPHYLAMAQSLASDADLDLTDEFRDREYASFFAGTLEPHTSPASPPGRLLSIHAPGLPLLVLPAYAAGGYAGVKLLLAALAALAAALSQRLIREVTGSAALAFAAWAALALTPPLPYYALSVYPETPAALAAVVLLLAARRDATPSSLLAAAVAAAALPWLHPKFLPLAAVGLGLVLARRGPRVARGLAALAFASSVAGLLAWFRASYGSASLSAAYGPGFAADVSLAQALWGVPALFLDRQFGLLFASPVWLLAAAGLVPLLARRAGDALRALLVAASVVVVGGSFSMWWGGACPPARFVVPALPGIVLLLAAGLRSRAAIGAGLGALGLAFLLTAADVPSALHNRNDGESALLRVLAPSLDLDSSLPSFVETGARGPALAATALAALALGARFGGPGLLAGALAFLAVQAGLRERPLLDPRAAPLELLSRWDAGNLVGAGAAPRPEALAIPLELPGAPWLFSDAGPARRSRPIDLPPGLYDVGLEGRVVEALPTARVLRLDLLAGELLLERRYLREDQAFAPVPLLLPAGVRRLVFEAAWIQGSARVEGVRLRPRAVLPRSRRDAFSWPRLPLEDRFRVPLDGVRVTPLDLAEPEGQGFRLFEIECRFLVEAPRGATVALLLDKPRPAAGDVLVWGDRRVRLTTASRQLLSLPADAGAMLGDSRVVPVRLRSYGSLITFSGSPGGTSETDSRSASPGDLPSVTTTSPPPDSGK
ncbi:MAG: hypothetical protein AB7O37_14980 [Vicinamibacteria bacterium]